MKPEEEEDNYHENDKNKSPTKKDDHQTNNFLGYITNYTIGYLNKEKSGNKFDVKRVCGTFFIYSNCHSRVLCVMHVHPLSFI